MCYGLMQKPLCFNAITKITNPDPVIRLAKSKIGWYFRKLLFKQPDYSFGLLNSFIARLHKNLYSESVYV